jgi:hypothetical protein
MAGIIRRANGGGAPVEPRVPPATPPPPISVPSPAPVSPAEKVDDAFLFQVAKINLPDNADRQNFLAFSRNELPELAQDLVDSIGINLDEFEAAMSTWLNTVRERQEDLNKKTVRSEPSEELSWPSMPGSGQDEACTSLFDANDLALRGRKSVLSKRYFVPLVFPDFDPNPTANAPDPSQPPSKTVRNWKWLFGQKIDYQQEWRHEAFTLGELVSSLSLLPDEELTIEVSTWQRTKEEISQEVSEEKREEFSREQKRTDEESATNEAAASNGWSSSASGSLNYGPISASASASAQGSTEQRTDRAEKHITEATSKATNEVSLKRAVKMTQTTEAGSESRTTRRLKNPNSCHTVTYNFFQIVKLFDVQLRVDNDAPILMLPSIFPAFYSEDTPLAGEPVKIPYYAIESFTSPALFLTQFFEVDRDLSQDINGFALRVRIDPGRSPKGAIRQLAEALIIAFRYLIRVDPVAHLGELIFFVTNYALAAKAIRQRIASTYGVGKGHSEQITTPGIYADSMLGRCTACENYVEASRYVDVMRQEEERKHLEAENKLLELERQRRVKLLEAKKLEPFEPVAPQVPQDR